MPGVVGLYFLSQKAVHHLHVFTSAFLTGLWLGALRREHLHRIDQAYYDGASMYRTVEYNTQGLFAWEQQAIATHFGGCKRIVVAAAGGGREVLGLKRLGYEPDAFECHPALAAFANELLSREGVSEVVRSAPRDACPADMPAGDGVVFGWAAYTLIRGRQQRVAFLRQLRGTVRPGSPLLVSFFPLAGNARRYKLASTIGNAVARLLRRDPVEIGDFLQPNYVHLFSESALRAELSDAGWETTMLTMKTQAHAVARAV